MTAGLPPIGAEIPCSRLAVNVPIQIEGTLLSVDFRGGIKHRVDVNPDNPMESVRLRTVGHRMSAELPDGDETGGTLTIEQNDVDVDSPSTLTLTRKFPPMYELREVTSFTLTVERGEGEPLVLVTKEPMVLLAQLTQFPPRGDLYRLEKPVELVLPDDPAKVMAVIEKFPVKVGGL
ncbi:hypothetical protein [Streptomyces sp. PanSC19]|uniref:hypothetical protein n=1 Tax=Streptomyces sp. PanSC19 TaxID=1520455 RepID=UPI0021A4D095|nr:hypothetical protein [Streptomyces sp. PanSC19]